MAVQMLSPQIYSVGSRDWDRKLFDELIPLPDGTSYNSYLIQGSDKTALIDTVDPPKTAELFSNLKELNVDTIDYIISNHAEQDHSGAIPEVLKAFPKAKVVTNNKCKLFLKDHLLISEEDFVTVEDRDTLSLGNKTLEFIFTPWVHWPETMVTYLQEDKILFTCDLFGSHLATSDLFVQDESKVIEDAKRYYAEIMMPFRPIIKKNIQKIETLGAEFIAPSHGPVYNKPEIILNAYRDWISDNVRNKVVLAYVSMHGSTGVITSYLSDQLIEKGVQVKLFNLTESDIGQLAMSLVDTATLVLGTPTVLTGPHPAAVYAATLVNALKPKLRYATVVGSYGWGGIAVDVIVNSLKNLKVEFLDPLLIKGHPKEEDFKSLKDLAQSICLKHKGLFAKD
jgi:flavorubredoxin